MRKKGLDSSVRAKKKRPPDDHKQESRTLDPSLRDQASRTLAEDKESVDNDEEERPTKRKRSADDQINEGLLISGLKAKGASRRRKAKQAAHNHEQERRAINLWLK
jgi:hypothetical protein